MLSTLLTLATVGALVIVVLSLLLWWRQESFIFFPRANDPMLLMKHQAHRIQIRSPGATLEGWWIENPRARTAATILYFGGNAEDVLYTATTASLLEARHLLVVNYRGFGRSSGAPGQKALYEDGLAIYDYAARRPDIAHDEIFVMGRSLGSGVAAMLASERPIAGAILVTPFDSLAAVAARHYSFLPVRWLIRHPFPSHTYAQRAKAPALMLAAQNDKIIPPVHAELLQKAWGGPAEMHVLSDVGHNDIEMHEEYYGLINAFLLKKGLVTGD